MRFKPKGRKIYRQKTRFERFRSFWSNTGAVVSTLLIAAALGFVGYSAGGPIIRFLQGKDLLASPEELAQQKDTSVSAEVLPSEEETETTAEETTEAPTEPPTTEPPTEPAPEIPEMRGYILPTAALVSRSALDAALELVPKETTHILIPLKTAGGSIWYATTLTDAAKAGAVQAALPLRDIYEAVMAKRCKPVAVLDLLGDAVYAQAYPDAAYHLAGSDVLWTASDGKPRVSPFSSLTLDYAEHLAAEISGAGFTAIVCTGLDFPVFSAEDSARLDARCTAPDRYTALTELVQAMQAQTEETEFYIEVSGMDILSNRTDALEAAEQLELTAILATVNAADYENAALRSGLSTVHPTVFVWEGLTPPEDAQSYIQAPVQSEVTP